MRRREAPPLARFGWRKWSSAAALGVSRQPGSLTAALRRVGPVEVKLLRQGPARPDRHERAVLGRQAGRVAVVREILLFCAGSPVIYGRTAIVPGDLRGAWRALSSLGTRALGDFIFSDRAIVRGPFVVKRLARADPMLRRIRGTPAFASNSCDDPTPPGVRRRLIVRRGRAVVLTEAFLSRFPAEALGAPSPLGLIGLLGPPAAGAPATGHGGALL